MLLPAAAGVTAAVRPPALDTVRAAPGTVLMNLNFPLRQVQIQEFAVVGQADFWVFAALVQHVSQGHVAVSVMMAIGLAVRGNVNELGMFTIRVKSLQQALQKLLATA